MRRLERLHAITNHLRARSPRTVAVSSLADRFEVSTRTIERDLRSLQDAGVPVYATAGRTGGYAILPDFAMGPIRLTAQEATACLAALDLMRRSPYAKHAVTAADKVAASLPDAVREAIVPGAVTTVPPDDAAATGAWVDALHARHLVEIGYGAERSPRLVEPYTALRAGGHWYLIGWCRTRDAVRGFRCDRIHSLRATGVEYRPTHSDEIGRDLARWDAAPADQSPSSRPTVE